VELWGLIWGPELRDLVMMGRLSKLIVVDNLRCPKCKRNSAEIKKKKNYPQIKRICWNLLTLIMSGQLQLVSEPWYRFWEEIKKGCWCSLIYCRMVRTRQEIRTDLSTAGRGNRNIDFSEGQEESPLEDTASHAPVVSTQAGHEESSGPQIR
jgi:hypothetical protein